MNFKNPTRDCFFMWREINSKNNIVIRDQLTALGTGLTCTREASSHHQLHMVKLFYTETSSGAANFIAANIAKVDLETEQVDIRTHKTASGADFYSINPKGNVPCIVLDDGTILNENAATLQYIGDLDASHSVLPEAGRVERYEVIGMLSYIGTEYHKTVQNLFNPSLPADVRAYFQAGANAKLSYINSHMLNGKRFLVAEKLSVADIYLYICLTWSIYIDLDLRLYPNVAAFCSRMQNMEEIRTATELMVRNPTSSLG